MHTQPCSYMRSQPSNSLPRGWLGQGYPLIRTPLCPPADTVHSPGHELTIGPREGPQDGAGGDRDRDAMGAKGSVLQAGRKGSPSLEKASLVPVCFPPTGLGLQEAWGEAWWGLPGKGVPPQQGG